jgi:hypothetical protein
MADVDLHPGQHVPVRAGQGRGPLRRTDKNQRQFIVGADGLPLCTLSGPAFMSLDGLDEVRPDLAEDKGLLA